MPTSKEISGLHIKPVDLQDPVLFRLNQNFDLLAQLILKSQGQISSVSATVNSLLGTSSLLTGLHADRVATPASANQLTLFWEQDRDALYVSIDVSGTWTWVWVHDNMRDSFANRPADLGANDVGFLFEDTTPGYTYRWNGATWDVVEILTDLVTIVKSGGDAPEYVRSYGGIPRLIFQQAAGTSAAPTKTVSGAPIMQIGGRGYEQVTPGFAADDKVAIIGKAGSDWTAASQETKITLEVTPSGSTTRAAAVTITSSNTTIAGTLTVNSGAATGTLVGITTTDLAGYLTLTASTRTVRFGADGSIGPHFGSTTHAGIFFPDADDLLPMVALTPSSAGVVHLGRAGYWFGSLFSAGNVSFSRNAAHSVLIERRTTANSAGTDLTLAAAAATLGATAKAGGTVYVAGGTSTDTAGSEVQIQTATPGAAASGDHTATTKVTITGPGVLDATGCLRVTAYAAPTSGAGVEVGYTGGVGYVQSYDRTGSAYMPLVIYGEGGGYVRIGSGGIGINKTPTAYSFEVSGDIDSTASYRTGGTAWLNSTRDASFATLKTADITTTGAIPCADADDTLIESGLVVTSGKITTYATLTVEGMGAAIVADYVHRTGESATIGATNFSNGDVAGHYLLVGYCQVTTGDGTAGTLTLQFDWTDDVGAFSSSSSITLTTTGRNSLTPVSIRLASGNITYKTTVAGAINNARYALELTLLRLA